MKRKKLLITSILTGLAFLSVIIVVLFKNDHFFKGSYKDNEAITYSNEADPDINSSDNTKNIINKEPDGSSKNENVIIQNEINDEINNEVNDKVNNEVNSSVITNTSDNTEPSIIPEDIFDTIIISAAGDVTLGRDEIFGWERTFDHELEVQGGDFGYFFRNVKDIFEADDITIVNLETTLTTATKKAQKKYRFKADPSYVNILKEGNIEAVSIANNHTLDFLDKGYEDTRNTLDEAQVGYFGYEHKYITDVRGIKIGILGFYSMNFTDKLKDEIQQSIDELRNDGADLVVTMFHWGDEGHHKRNLAQKKMAYFSIDSGADLVLGSHPHVLQGIEEYNGKQIVYSLGNFCFGGNKNPSDKDSMVYVHKFNFKNNELISQEYEVIPCSISSLQKRNNYQPTPLEGKDAERVLKKIDNYSDF